MRKLSILPFVLAYLITNNYVLGKEKKCNYVYDQTSTKLEWKAYKFTEKAGVPGSFDSIQVSGAKRSNDPISALRGIKFKIKTDSVNSNNPDRDMKIKKYFFNTESKLGKEISGSFQNITGTESGTVDLILTMNGKKQTVPMTFTLAENKAITLLGNISVSDFGLNEGLKALNEVCLELHKGKDGNSVLWPTVDLKVTSTLKESCK